MSRASLPNKVIVNAPATTANLGPGFDVFGMSLEHPSDKVTITPISEDIKIDQNVYLEYASSMFRQLPGMQNYVGNSKGDEKN